MASIYYDTVAGIIWISLDEEGERVIIDSIHTGNKSDLNVEIKEGNFVVSKVYDEEQENKEGEER